MKKAAKTRDIPKNDPLYAIFEQNLLNFQDPDMDRMTLVLKVVSDYVTYLRKKNISVPRALEQPIVEELARQVNDMLIKKIYGCMTVQEFQEKVPSKTRRAAKSRWAKIVR